MRVREANIPKTLALSVAGLHVLDGRGAHVPPTPHTRHATPAQTPPTPPRPLGPFCARYVWVVDDDVMPGRHFLSQLSHIAGVSGLLLYDVDLVCCR